MFENKLYFEVYFLKSMVISSKLTIEETKMARIVGGSPIDSRNVTVAEKSVSSAKRGRFNFSECMDYLTETEQLIH